MGVFLCLCVPSRVCEFECVRLRVKQCVCGLASANGYLLVCVVRWLRCVFVCVDVRVPVCLFVWFVARLLVCVCACVCVVVCVCLFACWCVLVCLIVCAWLCLCFLLFVVRVIVYACLVGG